MTDLPHCPRCGAEWELNDPCPECGLDESNVCEACGTPLDSGDWCSECDETEYDRTENEDRHRQETRNPYR